ncbi:hypothetical protein HOY82DRAFT_624857 [Tuber indicum]|nr:hypothetical protein HOY82DRAFT_624857 [Tuber indicum]
MAVETALVIESTLSITPPSHHASKPFKGLGSPFSSLVVGPPPTMMKLLVEEYVWQISEKYGYYLPAGLMEDGEYRIYERYDGRPTRLQQPDEPIAHQEGVGAEEEGGGGGGEDLRADGSPSAVSCRLGLPPWVRDWTESVIADFVALHLAESVHKTLSSPQLQLSPIYNP